ncbi:rhodanese-like domain-containing protein [Sulfurimonas sp.]|nr:rhodanese-like domain-containing protein [Sulfurimonas sp.]
MLYSKGIILADFNFLSPQEASQIIKNEENNVTILDVRTNDEYKTLGYIKDALVIPVENLELRLNELSEFKNKKILVYCANGNRSISASRTLHKHGFYTYNINGGINNWKTYGLPIQKPHVQQP